jgi:hypothetical protein
MSRWTTAFEQHPFQSSWKNLIAAIEAVQVDDQTITTSVIELARLKKVICYLDEMIIGVDPEMTPMKVWANFQQQTDVCLQHVKNYVSDKNIGHITQANDSADNLLTYIKPYFVLPEKEVAAVRTSARKYASEVEKYIEDFQKKATTLTEEIEGDRKEAKSYRTKASVEYEKIDGYSKELFSSADEKPSIETRIKKLVEDLDSKTNEIRALHKTLLVGDDDNQSTEQEIIASQNDIEQRRDTIKEWQKNLETNIDQLKTFHTKIFGEKNEESGETTGGLEAELNSRMTQLIKYEDAQSSKHDTLLAKIESLLPGATSAGLASSYEELKKGFSGPIKTYTWLFYGSLLFLVLAAIIMSIKHIGFSPFSIDFVELPEWDFVLKALLYKVPFVGPMIWLAIFASVRRSQYERLQQEYAHKQALASSYESYKKQLIDLKDSDELQKELIAKAIEAIAYNASKTLDGKHGEEMPLNHVLKNISPDDLSVLKRLREIIKNTASTIDSKP